MCVQITIVRRLTSQGGGRWKNAAAAFHLNDMVISLTWPMRLCVKVCVCYTLVHQCVRVCTHTYTHLFHPTCTRDSWD